MTHQIRALVALVEDQNSDPSTHVKRQVQSCTCLSSHLQQSLSQEDFYGFLTEKLIDLCSGKILP